MTCKQCAAAAKSVEEAAKAIKEAKTTEWNHGYARGYKVGLAAAKTKTDKEAK